MNIHSVIDRKNKLLFFVTLLLFNSIVFADDAWIDVAGGSISVLGDENNNVQMLSETISITLEKEFYHVDVTSFFKNYSEDITLNIGFPKWAFGSDDIKDFIDLEIWQNNELISDIPFISAKNDNFVLGWYVRTMFFPKNNTVSTQIKYKVPYGHGRPVDYLYGTGRSWKDSINEIKINVKNNANKWIYGYRTSWREYEHSFIPLSENEYEIIINDIDPIDDDIFMLFCGDVPGWDTIVFSNRAMWSQASNINLDDDAFSMLTLEQLRIFRNFYFAIYGYRFKSEDLNTFFRKYKWYNENPNFIYSSMSDFHKNMVNRIQEFERKKKEYSK